MFYSRASKKKNASVGIILLVNKTWRKNLRKNNYYLLED